ncbi:hypothetical protein Ark11_1621 [Candidatus Ichthyocystis hellenicum]|uniref:Uncharacterized protein n=1 Tax=Candidatus Ichthyocystis hellenicum TaxID=1561003 RepID=A0A0S4M8C4_9BURK|nr:hypothetical protein Ark11_1617 [Candidatus Ichthyocystis hellenicum]CUT18412.1 hypothetical protein Ark11_1621 [Candidatus Ichthyocystis hellenicum]
MAVKPDNDVLYPWLNGVIGARVRCCMFAILVNEACILRTHNLCADYEYSNDFNDYCS